MTNNTLDIPFKNIKHEKALSSSLFYVIWNPFAYTMRSSLYHCVSMYPAMSPGDRDCTSNKDEWVCTLYYISPVIWYQESLGGGRYKARRKFYDLNFD